MSFVEIEVAGNISTFVKSPFVRKTTHSHLLFAIICFFSHHSLSSKKSLAQNTFCKASAALDLFQSLTKSIRMWSVWESPYAQKNQEKNVVLKFWPKLPAGSRSLYWHEIYSAITDFRRQYVRSVHVPAIKTPQTRFEWCCSICY